MLEGTIPEDELCSFLYSAIQSSSEDDDDDEESSSKNVVDSFAAILITCS